MCEHLDALFSVFVCLYIFVVINWLYMILLILFIFNYNKNSFVLSLIFLFYYFLFLSFIYPLDYLEMKEIYLVFVLHLFIYLFTGHVLQYTHNASSRRPSQEPVQFL